MQTYTSSKTQSWLSWFLKGILLLGAIILIARLSELQIIKGAYYRDLAENNRIRSITIKAPRGEILARGGEILVGNKEVKFKVEFDKKEGFKKVYSDTLGTSTDLVSEWERTYPLGTAFAHIGGYLAEVNEDEVGKADPNCLQKGPHILGSLVGRSGLEEFYDCTLRGIDGQELFEVDASGQKLRTFGRRVASPGTDVKTTIDLGLQKKLQEVFNSPPPEDIENYNGVIKGAAIITDKKGEVLALYSSPSFDPSDIGKSLDDTNLPLFNRSIAGSYHPGSIFKIITATAALEDEKIDKDYQYEDTGVVKVNDFDYTNWYFTQYGGTEGVIDLPRAIARSTDTFFYKAGELVGVDSLVDWANKFGLSEPTGIDLPQEISGLVPDPKWKKRVKGENWFLGNTFHLSIGQGDLALTPAQTHRIAMAIANNGSLCNLKINSTKAENCQDLNISTKTIDLIKKGMLGACSQEGTAYPFFGFDPIAACKTGTAQTSEENVTHAWFTIFAPADDPQIVATVLVEKGGEGSRVAAPLAKEILDYYFHEKN